MTVRHSLVHHRATATEAALFLPLGEDDNMEMREQALDVAGQEIMTADKVTLRMNALVTYRVTDARKAVMATDSAQQSLYREAQLALRAVVGTRDLDSFLTDKDAVTSEFKEQVRQRANDLGLDIVSVGVRDVILPGDMKVLMNQVSEAKKAAEANLISRREETAAMRSQVNTARLLADNPTLMRLRELEVLERIATTGKLNVVLGEKGLTDEGAKLSCYSVNHGAGRRLGRKAAKRALDQRAVDHSFEEADILSNCRTYPLDEAPAAYKDFDEVLRSVKLAGLASEVARLKARFVIKDGDKADD